MADIVQGMMEPGSGFDRVKPIKDALKRRSKHLWPEMALNDPVDYLDYWDNALAEYPADVIHVALSEWFKESRYMPTEVENLAPFMDSIMSRRKWLVGMVSLIQAKIAKREIEPPARLVAPEQSSNVIDMPNLRAN